MVFLISEVDADYRSVLFGFQTNRSRPLARPQLSFDLRSDRLAAEGDIIGRSDGIAVGLLDRHHFVGIGVVDPDASLRIDEGFCRHRTKRLG